MRSAAERRWAREAAEVKGATAVDLRKLHVDPSRPSHGGGFRPAPTDTDLATAVQAALAHDPRLAGSEADARAVQWAKAKFAALGYDKVWTQPVTFPKWERRSERGEVLGAHAQPLVLAALGGIPGGTVEGEVVRFDSLEALQARAVADPGWFWGAAADDIGIGEEKLLDPLRFPGVLRSHV